MTSARPVRAVAALAIGAALFAATAPQAAAADHSAGGALPSARTVHAKALPLRSVRSVPAEVDLTKYAATPGDQKGVGACVSWAIDHSAMSILENEQGIKGGPQAPMYTYAQIARGSDNGSNPGDTFQIAEQQGVDSASDYWQGDTDYTTQPDAKEKENAKHWKLSGHTQLSTGSGLRADVEKSLAAGEPVVMTFGVYDKFRHHMTADLAKSYNYQNDSSDKFLGYHEVAIVGYNDKGIRIENSWTTGWGDGGYANLSWSFAQSVISEANAVGKLVQ